MTAKQVQRLFNPFEGLAQIAEREIGTMESPRGTNLGKEIRKYKAATDLDPDDPWPWCMAFVSYCLQQFAKFFPEKVFFKQPPRLAAVAAFRAWADKNGFLIFYPSQVLSGRMQLRRGDIVIYKKSHTGITVAVRSDNAFFSDVSGNSNSNGSREGYEVVARPQSFSRVLYFARPPARALPVEKNEKKGKKK